MANLEYITAIRESLEQKRSLSLRATAKLINLDSGALSRNLRNQSRLKKYLTNENFTELEITSWFSTGVPRRAALKILEYYAYHVSKHNQSFAYNSLRALQHKKEPPKLLVNRTKTEMSCKNLLAAKLKGQTEVITPVGNIDILTNSEVIEVKNIRGWKSAIGQVIAYGSFYPLHSKRIHLFGKVDENYLLTIKTIAEKHKIEVSWET
jgi:hypothetical protein